MALKITEADDYYYLIIRGMEYQVKKTSVTFGSIQGKEIPFLSDTTFKFHLIKRTFNLSIENIRESDFESLIQERILQKRQKEQRTIIFPDVYFGEFKIDQVQLVACIPVGGMKPENGFYSKVLLKFESQLFL